ncbi:hypothetical protein SAMN05443574_103294 [Haloarcula vallismortis]|uniref:Uncharacterized protein n=1 Tax=Haloarcula vallismortis TaxID=28442 RepID=A0A1H2TM69_HALVA|nr:hypothetical protein [Haloarcula vallismortis]SDW44920.1 hypothetical protein SAMN05443574_103294 [Haloarcula vallismortis]
MTTYARIPGKDETVEYRELDYVSASLFKSEEDAELEIEEKEGIHREKDLEIYRECDDCGRDDREDITLYRVAQLGKVGGGHYCQECLGI